MATPTPVPVFSAEDREATLADLARIRQRLSFLIDLSTEQRKTMTMMGDKSRAFVGKALVTGEANPGMLPRSFDISSARGNLDLVDGLQPVIAFLVQLLDLCEDTSMQAGSDAYAVGRRIYEYARAGVKDYPVEQAVADMGQLYTRKPRRGSKLRSKKTEKAQKSE
ncbi:MAG: hypothetical protein ACKV2V_07505 [Blastocatellia bacterium]